MARTLRPLVAGNWKMHGLADSARELDALVARSGDVGHVDLVVAPPATLVGDFARRAKGSPVMLAGQDCHPAPSGAHTGDISAEMLADLGAGAVIIGHSERREGYGESDALVRAKAEAARRAGLLAILCVGETLDERKAGRAADVIAAQLACSVPDDTAAGALVVAYEPLWAIGSGLTPTPDDIADILGHARERLAARFGQAGEGIRLLYGGSVKPDNAASLLNARNVDGALVGGASLKADDFLAIARAVDR